ncbi:uncharacterized protein METZ01_LOCUS427970, partial [marine metagenome]
SRRIKTDLIYHKWSSDKFDHPVNLIQYWEIDGPTKISLNPISWIIKFFSGTEKPNYDLIWENSALEILKNRISASENKSGLISIEVLMEEPNIAAKMANLMYNTIVHFTIEIHGKQAKLNREFIERRQAEINTSLASSEEVLKIFRQGNRSIIGSPQLEMELERLMREVEIKTQVYITLQQQYELARIEEVKESPSVVVIDEARPSVEKHKPKRKAIVMIATFVGGIIAVGFSIIQRNLNK